MRWRSDSTAPASTCSRSTGDQVRGVEDLHTRAGGRVVAVQPQPPGVPGQASQRVVHRLGGPQTVLVVFLPLPVKPPFRFRYAVPALGAVGPRGGHGPLARPGRGGAPTGGPDVDLDAPLGVSLDAPQRGAEAFGVVRQRLPRRSSVW